LALDELKENEDVVTVNDIDLVIAESVLPYTRGNVIDYQDAANGRGFTINATASGC